MEDHFNNIANTKEGTDDQNWEKIKTDGDMYF